MSLLDKEHKKNLMQTGNFARALGVAKAQGKARGIANSSHHIDEEDGRPQESRHNEHR